jgi:extracellular elastinolytic metalloproteinase
VGDPLHGNRSVVKEQKVVDPIASPKGWIASDRKDTVGNNVWAQWNPRGVLGFQKLYRPSGLSKHGKLKFDFDLDASKDPAEYADAAVTNLFFMVNHLHDLFYNFGFDEVSGNYQDDNFGRGGQEGDAMIAHAQGMATLFTYNN